MVVWKKSKKVAPSLPRMRVGSTMHETRSQQQFEFNGLRRLSRSTARYIFHDKYFTYNVGNNELTERAWVGEI